MLITLYRLQFVPVSKFFVEFTDLLETYVILNEDFVIAGDINVHVEAESCISRKLSNNLDLFDLKQNVVGPTHIMGHTIDVIITPNKDGYVSDIETRQIDLSQIF